MMGEIPQQTAARRAWNRTLILILLTLVFAAPAASQGAEAAWRRVASPNFEVFTDAGAERGQRIAERLEQARQAFTGLSGATRLHRLPLRVYLFASRKDFERYRPTEISEGFFQSGPETDYIVVHAQTGELRRIAVHEYVHAVLHHTFVRLPQWFEEGTAEFYSTMTESDGRLIVGSEIPSHIGVLRSASWLDADTLSNARDPDTHGDKVRTGVFYAESWALVHMLYTQPGYREKFPKYMRLLASAASTDAAFEQAFEKPLSAAVEDLRQYVERGVWRTSELAWTPPPALEVRTAAITQEEATRVRLDLELQMGLWDVSAQTVAKLAKARGESAESETARALLAMSRNDTAAARAHLEKAFSLGATEPRTYFEYAMLLKETREPRERVVDYLRKTVAMNPRYAEAWFVLGVELSNAGRPEEAAPALEQAVEILPRQSYFWHALALAYHKTGRKEDAVLAARRSLDAARTEEERRMASAAIQLAESPPDSVELKDRPSVETPATWFNRRGDARIEGTLKRIVCLGAGAKLVVAGPGKELALLVADPGKVVLKNAGGASFEFACGEAGRHVVVEYVARDDPSTGTAGEVTAIELKE